MFIKDNQQIAEIGDIVEFSTCHGIHFTYKGMFEDGRTKWACNRPATAGCCAKYGRDDIHPIDIILKPQDKIIYNTRLSLIPLDLEAIEDIGRLSNIDYD